MTAKSNKVAKAAPVAKIAPAAPAAPVAVSKQAKQLRELIGRGKEQGYLTYAEVNDHLPNDIVETASLQSQIFPWGQNQTPLFRRQWEGWSGHF